MIQIKKAAQPQPRAWGSLAQLHQAPALTEYLDQEFPGGPEAVKLDEPSRRQLFQVMGASLALAGMTACRRPEDKILPLVRGVEDYVPGVPMFYSTGASLSGRATGLLVEVNEFRPTKIEGHPGHPSSKGSANAYHQASILGLYDPERSKTVLKDGALGSWEDFSAAVSVAATQWGTGSGLRILSERSASPTLGAVRATLMSKYPEARWVEYEAAAPDFASEGTKLALGQPVEPLYHFGECRTVLSLDADFLGLDNENLAYIKDYSACRKVMDGKAHAMCRLYMVEGQFSLTGMNADHRLRMKASEVAGFAAEIAAALGIAVEGAKASADDKRKKFVAALVKDLQASGAQALVLAGPRQPAVVHALAALINEKLGSVGRTVTYLPSSRSGGALAGLRDLTAEMAAGKVDTLLILGVNAAFTAPADCRFTEALKGVKLAIHSGLEYDETAKACEGAKASWHLPEAHFLEAWGDLRAADGTVTIQQPVIKPLYGGRSPIEVVAMVAGSDVKRGYELVRSVWMAKIGGEDGWRKALHDGVVPDAKPTAVAVKGDVAAVSAALKGVPGANDGIEVQFVPSFGLYDGRFANNSWLQECPEPMTKITWGNAALMSPATARQLGVFPDFIENEKMKGKVGENWDRSMNLEDPAIRITKAGRSVRLPVFPMPGMADGTIALSIGYGRTQVGTVGSGQVGREMFLHQGSRVPVGVDVYPVRTLADFGFGGGFEAKADGMMPRVATTQDHFQMADRPIVRQASVEEYAKHPDVIEHMNHVPDLIQLYENKSDDYTKGYQWGMAIDLNACTGCNACVVACQAENNIPVVGREGVIRGREMHWIRLDRYFIGSEDEPEAVVQPLNCQQCENAPCENVCPVAATAHSPEGLNDMAYNRCVGTRYCANNCPFKVRRFNYFNYHRHIESNPQRNESLKMAFNPDVTVRMRGIMEKCTYCVQRIQEKKILAKTEGRRSLRDGEIQTACQQTCPADAIVFGNINDPNSKVSQMRKQHRSYAMLAELNLRPRTTYLAKLRNPHPDLAGASTGGHDAHPGDAHDGQTADHKEKA